VTTTRDQLRPCSITSILYKTQQTGSATGSSVQKTPEIYQKPVSNRRRTVKNIPLTFLSHVYKALYALMSLPIPTAKFPASNPIIQSNFVLKYNMSEPNLDNIFLTRKLYYRKDDRAMRIGMPQNRTSSSGS